MNSDPSDKKTSTEDDFFESLGENGRDLSMVKPSGLWQKFWHNTKLRIVSGVLILLMLMVGVIWYFYYSYEFSSQTLTDYVPASAWLYLEFNFNAGQWQQLQKQAPQLAGATNDFFIQQGLSQELINLSSRIALVGSLEDDELAWTWILRTSQPRQLEAFLEPDTFLRQPGTHIAVVSTHPQAVKRFNFLPGRSPAMPQVGSLWFGFVKPDELTRYFSDISERNIFIPLLVDWLRQSNRSIPLAVNQQSDLIMLSLDNLNNPGVIWPDPVSEHDLVVSNVNLAQSLAELEKAISGLPLASFFWQSFKEQSAENYALNWHSLQEHLDQPATVALTSRQTQAGVDSFDELPLDSDSYEIIVKLTENSPATDQFTSDLLRHYMAYRFPSQVARSLADGTTAYDLIVDFDRLDFTNSAQRNGWRSIVDDDATSGFILWSDNEALTVVNDPNISARRLSDFRQMDFSCGNMVGENLYASRYFLKFLPLAQDFKEVIITSATGGIAVCLH